MGRPCTSVADGIPPGLRALAGAWAFAVLMIVLACVMQIAASSHALASGFHHHASAASPAAVQDEAIAPVSRQGNEVVAEAMQYSDISDCDGHASHKSGSKSKGCCASLCCAADVARHADFWHVPGIPAHAPWIFPQQFVVLKQASGLDRPPDFCA